MAFKKMLFYSAVAVLSSIASAVPIGCAADVRVISVRGSYEVLGQSVLRDVFSALVGSGARAVLQGTPYPAALDWSNNAVYGGSVQQGVDNLKGIIRGAAQECPQQKIVLIGYSQGSNVIADALCGGTISSGEPLNGPYGDNIKAVVLFGDPTHSKRQSFVRGGGLNDGNIPRWDNINCAPYTDRIVSFCHANDPVCDDGSDVNQHLNYMPASDGEAVQFIWSKL